MKTQLTKEQSDRLIELGVPVDKQSGRDFNSPYQGIFTLTDLLEILPKNIRNKRYLYDITMYNELDHWYAGYTTLRPNALVLKKTEELIDALYELLIWTIENKYVLWI